MAKEIKQKIVLEGEKQYNQAIKDAQRNLRTLKSELKAETAELGANATAQQKNEAKAKSLKQQIQEQEKIVRTLREALKTARAQYGENADEVARWEQRLNGARTTLANMKNDLEGTGNGFRAIKSGSAEAVTAANSAASALERIGGAGEAMAETIEGIFSGIISTIKSAVTEVWGLITDTAAKANRWTDLAGYYGSSAQAIQMWDKSISAAGGDFQKFLNIVNQLAFGGKEQKITELLGVSKEEYQDDIKYALAVLDALEQKRDELGQGWYDSTMSELFGARRSADVSWFLSNAHGHEASNGEWINGWRDDPERFNGNEGAYGLNDQELKDLNDVYVLLQNIRTKWDDIKQQIAGGLGKTSLEITTSVSGFLDGLAEYMNAGSEGERQEALAKMRENMERFFRAVADIIRESIKILTDLGEELKGSDDPATQMIGKIMTGLADALQWMIDHQDEVVTALKVIFGTWLVMKLAAIAGKLTSIVASIKTIQLFNGWNPTGTPTSPTPTPTPTTTPTPTPVVNPTTAGEAIAAAEAAAFGGGGASAGGIGTGIAGGGTLSLGGVAGGTAVLAAWVLGVSEIVNDANRKANKAREMAADADRIRENLDAGRKDYSFSGINREAGAQGYIQGFMHQTGGQASDDGYAAMRNLATLLGPDVMTLFDYTNTSGEKWNKLTDMLDMGDRYAAVAAMIMNQAGVSGYDLNPGLEAYARFARNGGIGTEAYTELAAFFGSSMQYDPTTGKMIIPGVTGRQEIMPVINGVPLANMSGYVMTSEQSKPRYSNGNLWWGRPDLENEWGTNGTWDPSRRMAPGGISSADMLSAIFSGLRAGLPSSDMLTVTGSWWGRGSGVPDENGVSSGDLKGLKDMPAGVEAAAEKGVRKGISGLRVQIDGQDAGRILAPFVSAEIAKNIE